MTQKWQSVKLGDAARLINGRAYKKAELLDNGRYPVLRVGNFFTNRGWYYSDLELADDKYCDNGDLLYAWSASFGPRVWEGGKAIYHYHIWKIEYDSSMVDKWFLYYWFEWDKERIKKEQGAGTTMIHVTKGSMEQRRLELPPIKEQKRIVTILDEAFAGIDAAIANTEKNLANARELFESYLRSVFSSAPLHWRKSALSDICSIKHGFAFKSEYFSDAGPFIVLTPGSFYESGGFRDQGRKTKFYIGDPPAEYILSRDDFLIAMTEQAAGLLGSSLVVPESRRFLHNQRLGLVVVRDGVDWHNDFFFHQFNTHGFRSAVQETASGVKVRHTSPGKLGAIQVFVPSYSEQVEIGEKLNMLLSEVRKLESLGKHKLESLTELKKSLLQKAFSGELTDDLSEKELDEAVA